MKYMVNKRVVWLITFLIILLSFGLSIANYWSAFEQTRKQLLENSLPLSTDNIYTDIQKVIIEPSLISSMMSSDTFVRDWLKNDERDTQKIVNYLDAIKKKYDFSGTFLVSSETGKYYTGDGFLETLSPDNKDNYWYFRFSEQEANYEINIDNNALIDNNLLLFFNYKIFDENRELLGVVGVIFKTSYISKLFHLFKEYYKLNVYLMDNQGNVKLSEQGISDDHKSSEKEKVSNLLPEIVEKKSSICEYQYASKRYLVKSKYVDELGLYLVVEAELSQFTDSLQQQLLLNILISLMITMVIIMIILRTISTYTLQLNRFAHHDTLTELPNRRTFNDTLEKVCSQYQRDKRERCFIFFDIDNFKSVNDTYGHLAGDRAIVRVAEILKKQIRDSDYISRWGGEEFSALLVDSNLKDAIGVGEKIRSAIDNDQVLKEIINGGLTASFGVTAFAPDDSLNDIIARSDAALYEAKHAGKNCVRSNPEL